MKKLVFLAIAALLIVALMVPATAALAAKPPDNGFDQFGYNNVARIFNGTGESWAMGKLGMTHDEAEVYMGAYAHDKIVMKWTADWDRGNDEGWINTYPKAWTDNEWNGKVPGGSGEVWHYKIVWIGGSGVDYMPLPDGGYRLWGPFEVLMDQGTTADGKHTWLAKANPAGYGARK